MTHNLNSLFSQERLNAMTEAAKELRGGGSTQRNDSAAVSQILQLFQPGFGESSFHRDAAESYYVARQLEHLRPGIVEMALPPLEMDRLVPMDTTPGIGTEQYTVTFADQVGRSRVSKDMHGIIPHVDVSVSQTSFPMVSVLNSYEYTLNEARTAMQGGRALPADRAMRCREQIQRDLNEIALLGDKSTIAKGTGINGLYTLANTATYTIPTGTGGSKAWTSKNAREIIDDWNNAVSAMVVASLGAEIPDTTILPLARFELVTTKPVGDGTIDTVWTAFKRNNPHIKNIEYSVYLNEVDLSHGGWTGMRMMNYSRSALKLALVLPIPFEQLPPKVEPTTTMTVCHARTAGVVAMRPKSVSYADEI